jgi:hypothetical protein
LVQRGDVAGVAYKASVKALDAVLCLVGVLHTTAYGVATLQLLQRQASVSLNYCRTLNRPLLPPHACNVQGGFSEVQLAQDRLTGKMVALKIIFLNRPGLTADQVIEWPN